LKRVERHALRADFTLKVIFNLTKIDRLFWCRLRAYP
jgi:hypothetical protein